MKRHRKSCSVYPTYFPTPRTEANADELVFILEIQMIEIITGTYPSSIFLRRSGSGGLVEKMEDYQ